MTVIPGGSPTAALYPTADETHPPVTSKCPRCGAELTTFAMGETRASACEACSYVGVEADHTSEPASVESWDEALKRFRDDS